MLQRGILENSKAPLERDEDEDDKGHDVESLALTGSLSAQYGVSSSELYSQLSLNTRDQMINQIILIQVTFLFFLDCINKATKCLEKLIYIL